MDTYLSFTTGELHSHTAAMMAELTNLEFAQFEKLDAIKNMIDSMEDFMSQELDPTAELEVLRDMAAELITMFK